MHDILGAATPSCFVDRAYMHKVMLRQLCGARELGAWWTKQPGLRETS